MDASFGKYIGQRISGVAHVDGGVDWNSRRKRGLKL